MGSEGSAEDLPQARSDTAHGRGGRGKGRGRSGGKTATKDSRRAAATPAEKKIKEEVFLVVSLALTGRTPLNGSIMSLGAVAVLADRTIVGTFHANLELLHDAPGLPDVIGYWQSKPSELHMVTRNAVDPRHAFAALNEFCKPFGKCTLVGAPIMSMYAFLVHYFSRFCPGATSMPWGYSGVCARSFASGVLGVAVKDLAKSPDFVAACEGGEATGVPLNDALCAATYFTSLWRRSAGLPPCEVSWRCDKPPAEMLGAIASPMHSHPALRGAAPLPFCPYPSITDPDFDPAFAGPSPERMRGISCEWVVTEKVHGANMSLVTDGAAIRVAKRTGLLTAADAKLFFNFDMLLPDLVEPVRRIFAFVVEELEAAAVAEGKHAEQVRRVEYVAVFGELAGGEYHHADVPPNIAGRRVQNGVQYAPYNFFYAFDVAFRFADSQAWTFLPFESQQRAFDAVGMLCTRPLFCGDLAGALAFPFEFQSTIPGQLGLPPLPESIPNFAEGVVIRPVVEDFTFLDDTSFDEGQQQRRRVMIKVKHPRFREFVVKPAKDAPLEQIAMGLVGENRARAVLSKHTAEERHDARHMAALMAADILRDARGAAGGAGGDSVLGSAAESGTGEAALLALTTELEAASLPVLRAILEEN